MHLFARQISDSGILNNIRIVLPVRALQRNAFDGRVILMFNVQWQQKVRRSGRAAGAAGPGSRVLAWARPGSASSFTGTKLWATRGKPLCHD